jgi:F420-dependent oxidoreductase-like protein
MKLGLHVGYWGAYFGTDPSRQIEAVRTAERLGYDSVWTAEAYGSDAATILAWFAAVTERIKLGSAVFQMPGRSAAMTAMTAATIDQLSGGRMILGLGASGPQVSEGWHGQRFGHQLQRTREYVDIVRMALARERLVYDGETLQLPLPGGPGRALKLTIAPKQERIPIYLAAIGPRNTALAGEIADGWIPTFFSPEHVELFRDRLRAGALRADRSLDAFEIAPMVSAHVCDDLDAARDLMRPVLALYVGGMGSREQNFYKTLVSQYGFATEAQRVQDLYLEGKREEACRAVPDELVDLVCLVGSRERVAERMRAYRDAGVGTLILSPMATSPEQLGEQMQLLAEIAG